MKNSRRALSLLFLVMIMTVSGNTTELKRAGWNLISICEEMNRNDINMKGIEEIQNQNGQSIYTGAFAYASNLERLEAGYGYWIKTNTIGTQFDSGEARTKLEKPLMREGWNLMASCEDIAKEDINMSDIQEIQNQDGDTIYTGTFASASNLDVLLSGYGHWVKGTKVGVLFTAKQGLTLPTSFKYPVINNSGTNIETSYKSYSVKLYSNVQDTADAQKNHVGILLKIDGISLPILQIQDSYRSKEIVAVVFDANNKLIGLSPNTRVDLTASVQVLSLSIENDVNNSTGQDSNSTGNNNDNNTSTGGNNANDDSTGENDNDNDNDNDDDDDDTNSTGNNNGNNNNNSTGGNTTGNTTGNGKYVLSAWNDLGMHCMDGKDFSVFSVLPPYNNLHAQLKDKNGQLITSGVTLTYQATKGVDGKFNTSSITANNGTEKTNFWDYSSSLFGATLASNIGLTGNPMASHTPEALSYNATHQWWEAEGIPITPYNDDGSKNYYPLIKVVAKDSSGTVLASVDTVLPVSDEMDCKRCHASSAVRNDAKPLAGWVNNSDAEKDYKFNILRLHDERHPTAVSKNLSALSGKGYNYNSNGLEATVHAGTAVLCTACHKSNALPGVGIELKSFSSAIHSRHANVIDPSNGLTLNSNANRNACYTCHPGSQTACLRGAMGDAKNADGSAQMQCQSCHGNMSAVGSLNREGWLEEPNCQACHHDGERETLAINPMDNTLKHWADTRFATNLNTPAQGFSLYRFSTGHGKLQCEACHGSTHAIYPAHEADNKVSIAVQGHEGTIGECSACHSTVPRTVTGGPHGMHPIGQSWIDAHEDVAENNPTQCTVCHGTDYRGSVLSKTFTSRSFATEYGQKNFAKGHKVSCYDCHNGPSGD